MTRRHLRTAHSLFLITLLALSFNNCSKSSNDSSSSPGGPPAPVISNPGTLHDVSNIYGTADGKGNIQAFQDLQFKFKIPGAVGGSILTSSNLPSWLTINSASGEISGIPTDLQTTAAFSVTVTNGGTPQTAGPYTITVIGEPLKKYQWHLKNTGQSNFAGGTSTAGQDIHLDQSIASRILGQNIRIAISDSGVQEVHPDLAPNLVTSESRNYLNNYASTHSWLGSATPDTTQADNAHGTAVAGLAAAHGWLGIGSRGVAPLAKLIPFLFIQAQTNLANEGLSTQAINDQFSGTFDIFNFSWGDPQCQLIEYDATFYNTVKSGIQTLRSGKGAVYVMAGGNSFVGGLTDCYPNASASAFYLGNANFSEVSTDPSTISVGALSSTGIVAAYSTPGSNLWLSAPGGGLGYSTSSTNDALELSPALMTTDFIGQQYGFKTISGGKNTFDADTTGLNINYAHTATFNGTSSATPIVSGAVALMLSANPSLSWREVKYILATTADKVDAAAGNTSHPVAADNIAGYVYQQGWVTNAAGIPFHNWYGFGRVNVDKAVTAATAFVAGSLGTYQQTNSGSTWKYDSGNLALAVPAATAAGVTRTLTVSENFKIEAVQARVNASNCIGNLGIELTSPSGTKSILMNINSLITDTAIDSHIFLTNAFLNESSAGVWTMRLLGGKSGCTTTWNNWQLNVVGH